MDGIIPIEELVAEVSKEAPCGILDEANTAQISALDSVVKRAMAERFYLIRQACLGLFSGGKILVLTDAEAKATVEVKPVKHLKAAMVLAWVGLGLDGLRGFADGLVLMERLLKAHWDPLHPVANKEDTDDPYLERFNILAPLTFADPALAKSQSGPVMGGDSWKIEARLLKAVLLKSERHGELSLRDCLSPWAASQKITLPGGEDRTAEFIHEVRLDAIATLPHQQETVLSAISALEGIEKAFQSAPGTFKPKFNYLLKLLKAAKNVLDDVVPALVTTESTENKTSVTGSTKNPAGGSISSREEAVRRLVEVAEYFRRVEPSSPIPLIIERVRALAGLDFARLIEELELGEGAIKEFRKLAGNREQKTAEASK